MHEVSLFEAILNTNLINFLIMVMTLVWIVKKARLGDLIQKMADDIKLQVEKSATEAQDAINEYKATKKASREYPAKEKEILDNAQKTAISVKETIEKGILEKKEEIEFVSQKACLNEEKKYKKLTIDEIFKASVSIAQEEIVKRLDKKMHKKLINISIDELEKIDKSLL